MVATYEDAGLVVQLMRWSTEMKLQDSLSVLFSDDFDPEDTTTDVPAVREVLFFGEAVGALVKNNVLDKGLITDLLWFKGIWPRVRTHALAAREASGEPSLYEHFEALAS